MCVSGVEGIGGMVEQKVWLAAEAAPFLTLLDDDDGEPKQMPA